MSAYMKWTVHGEGDLRAPLWYRTGDANSCVHGGSRPMLVDFDVRALHDTVDGERPFAYTGEICMRGIECVGDAPMNAGC